MSHDSPAAGSLAQLIQISVAALKAERWETALDGLVRARRELGERTPRPVLAGISSCLHKLGRYAEAEAVALEGLGPQRTLIAPLSPPEETALPLAAAAGSEPVVSILCMTYNHERYLENALRGFLAQRTNYSFEVLVHDDASTDGTAAVIRRWQEKYPSIIRATLQTENQLSRGVRPFELLLRQARGRYVATCEGDDYWIDPSKLQRQVEFLERNPDFSCTAHNYYLYNEARLELRPWLHPPIDRVISEFDLMTVKRLLWIPTLVFRKTFSTLPPEREFAAVGDQFLTSYLGTWGKGAYFEKFLGAVRRENPYSIWTPVAPEKKELARVKTWAALMRLHENHGRTHVAEHLIAKIAASPLNSAEKARVLEESLALVSAGSAAAT